jgi:hypothetical protein
MPRTKRITTKTGGNSKRTTTFSSTGGKTESYSNRPTKSSPRRTVSYNHKTGKTRTTYSTKQGGGWTNTTSRTTGGSTRRRKNSNIDLSGLITLPLVFFISIAIWIMVEWPSTAPYIIGFALVIGLIIFIFSIIHYIIWGGILIGIIWLLSLL